MKKRTKQKAPYFIIGGILILILIVGGIYLYLDRQSSFHDELESIASLVTEQVRYEADFTTEGYTLENANVVLDPYHISPLTALIMFETEESVAPTVTIEGKDKWTTYT
ncbi:MAG: aryl-sulfate sulfotransferase N-terminal domain-containing protein, partial [Firmicutes bacterium]|nr:aryl-sulfate sulfotransferase N-terminal domain-containing protein [Bacillota bacterium]